MGEIFEVLMMLAFGCSWPLSIVKSYKCRTAKGKSPIFLVLIIFGYICGIVAKIININITYVVAFYCLNIVLVSIDLCLWFRNRRIDRKQEKNGVIL